MSGTDRVVDIRLALFHFNFLLRQVVKKQLRNPGTQQFVCSFLKQAEVSGKCDRNAATANRWCGSMHFVMSVGTIFTMRDGGLETH